MVNSVQKNVTLPYQMAKDLEMMAGRVGLSVSEYLRIIIFNATQDFREELRRLSNDSEKAVNDSMKAYEDSEYVTLETEEEIDDFLESESKNE